MNGLYNDVLEDIELGLYNEINKPSRLLDQRLHEYFYFDGNKKAIFNFLGYAVSSNLSKLNYTLITKHQLLSKKVQKRIFSDIKWDISMASFDKQLRSERPANTDRRDKRKSLICFRRYRHDIKKVVKGLHNNDYVILTLLLVGDGDYPEYLVNQYYFHKIDIDAFIRPLKTKDLPMIFEKMEDYLESDLTIKQHIEWLFYNRNWSDDSGNMFFESGTYSKPKLTGVDTSPINQDGHFLTNKTLSYFSGINHATISRYRSGQLSLDNMSLKNAQKLEDAYRSILEESNAFNPELNTL